MAGVLALALLFVLLLVLLELVPLPPLLLLLLLPLPAVLEVLVLLMLPVLLVLLLVLFLFSCLRRISLCLSLVVVMGSRQPVGLWPRNRKGQVGIGQLPLTTGRRLRRRLPL